MNSEYIRYLKERQASTSVGASTARGMGPKGTIQIARMFLADLDLKRFQKKSKTALLKELEITTVLLSAALPKKARRWGSARKFLNIFLRGCVYNKYLCSYYKLNIVEPWLEVPLDSHVAKGLKKNAGRGKLPRWPGVINLTPYDSGKFQEFASVLAQADCVNRVDLDLRFWRRVR